jgi:hypothetical protein
LEDHLKIEPDLLEVPCGEQHALTASGTAAHGAAAVWVEAVRPDHADGRESET